MPDLYPKIYNKALSRLLCNGIVSITSVFWLLHNVHIYHDNLCHTYLAAKTRVIYMSDHFPTKVPGHSNSYDKLYYRDVIMSEMASQITSLTTVYWSAYSGADHRKQQSPVSLVFVRAHKGPATQKMFTFYDVIMSGQRTVFQIHSNPIIARSVSPTYDFYHALVIITLRY